MHGDSVHARRLWYGPYLAQVCSRRASRDDHGKNAGDRRPEKFTIWSTRRVQFFSPEHLKARTRRCLAGSRGGCQQCAEKRHLSPGVTRLYRGIIHETSDAVTYNACVILRSLLGSGNPGQNIRPQGSSQSTFRVLQGFWITAGVSRAVREQVRG